MMAKKVKLANQYSIQTQYNKSVSSLNNKKYKLLLPTDEPTN